MRRLHLAPGTLILRCLVAGAAASAALALAGAGRAAAPLPSPATSRLAAPPAPGTTESFTYGSGLSAYPYIVYTPKGYRPGTPMPLVVMIHGCQTTAEQQMEANLYNPLADAQGFVVLYPDINPIEAAQPGPTARCWQFFTPLDWNRGQNDAAALAGMTRAVMSGWDIDAQRVYAMGMSAGAFMVSDLAAAYPDLYAAVGQNAGGAYADGGCLFTSAANILPVGLSAALAFRQMGPRARIVPKLVIGGDADNAVPPPCADKSLQQSLRTDNLVIDGRQTAPISLSPASVAHFTPPGRRAYTVSTYLDQYGCVIGQRYLVAGMGHFWSGGSSDPRLAAFTDPTGPSAAEISWSFFSRYRLRDTADPCRASGPDRLARPGPVHRHAVRRLPAG